ncbi:MAG: dihydroneopterin aldolase [Planktomarina sp.]
MTNNASTAFSHPIDRSHATADRPLDRISVRDLVLVVDIGAFQTERGSPQRIRFNVVVEVLPHGGAEDDDVDKILSYDRVTDAIEAELAAQRLNLLETLAERVADRILVHPLAHRVFVRLEKLDRGPGTLGVEIVRDDAASNATRSLEDTPKPVVVLLSQAACASPFVTTWVDAAQTHKQPVVFCVDADFNAGLNADHAMAQRRIDLLTYEQTAWVLGAQDGRCYVVGTRTELDWGMRNDQVMVWAPSKMVLDAVDGPQTDVRNTAQLCAWFASEIGASQCICIGDVPGAITAGFDILPIQEGVF